MSQKRAAVLLAVALFGCIGGFAYSQGHRAGRVSQLKDIIAAYNRRIGIDDNSNALGQGVLCQELGGSLDECERLNRSGK
jgi:hypothetical protein